MAVQPPNPAISAAGKAMPLLGPIFNLEAVAQAAVPNLELGAEWFALGPLGSAKRVELKKLYGQGSLPHVFIGGEWVGGLATGADGGLAGLVERDELLPKLTKAGALKGEKTGFFR